MCSFEIEDEGFVVFEFFVEFVGFFLEFSFGVE